MNATMFDRRVFPMPGGLLPPMRGACWHPAFGGYPPQMFPVMPESNYAQHPVMWNHPPGLDHGLHNPAWRPFPYPFGPPNVMIHSMNHKRGTSEPKRAAFHQVSAKDNGAKRGHQKSGSVKKTKPAAANDGVSKALDLKASTTQHQTADFDEVGGKRKPWRILLTGEQAREIYQRRPGQDNPGTSLALAGEFGVSVKTIRDIWNRETWIRATRPLWTAEEHSLHTAACHAKVDLAANRAPSEPARAAGKRELPSDDSDVDGGPGSPQQALATGSAKRMKCEDGEGGRQGRGLDDAAADAEAVAGLLMMCSAR